MIWIVLGVAALVATLAVVGARRVRRIKSRGNRHPDAETPGEYPHPIDVWRPPA